ncbi:NADH-quinone oxidoreductase subunit L [Acidisphaera rubrifaciens]|uniref:NADH-quinone oxidoreductase subunit L n=1 Tax=Acidisphaera rubrifaciens HS-AP3 TaxID=1231350 RepID=A0A0D6P815_9PROT|nr:NADH-quinone oxidoreductase subunit L [Acidisphaera rubrifaciens]GAN77481.1 NADH-quinone oxidoreductase subunit L [Acidisphaera rubrifaciens HS-AP3]
MFYAVAIFAPLIGALVSGLFGRAIGDRAAQAVSILCMLVAAACGVTAFFAVGFGNAPTETLDLGAWVQAGSFHVSWALRSDPLSTTMVGMVTFVSTLIHIYSIGYMGHEPEGTRYRFFSYLSAFTFAMLMLVTADNLLQLFFGWEGVGLMSYLLIGYWYDRPSACRAAIKAFIVNRIADLFFAVGVALVFLTFGSIEFPVIFGSVARHAGDVYHLFGTTFPVLEVIGFLLFIGAMGKSAQIGLHVWLPDAMEGPTPVSALIHAATMVTAGVFLMARMSPVMAYAPTALAFVTFIGGTTALFAATIGCAQTDIKRVIAYSTCSQLGYMFLAAGVGAYQASVFHLFTHAFFKALLFLSAGSVIHAMSDEQDMRRMGGLWRLIPVTYTVMWVGSLALAGVFPFSGYYSKDAILEAAYAAPGFIATYGWICGVLAAFLTAFYSWRLLIMTFHGKPRMDHHTLEHVHESPPVMTLPLVVLAIGALVAGYALHDVMLGPDWSAYWRGAIVNGPDNHIMTAMEHVPTWVSLTPSVVGLLGIATAYVCYMFAPGIPVWFATRLRPVYLFALNKWYFDELYDFLFVRPAMRLARVLWQVGDATIIDGMPNGAAALAAEGARGAVRIQTGSIATYAFVMLIGVVVLVGVFLLFR